MPNVYSPAGVTWTLSNNFCSARADAAARIRAALQRHQKVLPDIVAICIGAFAVQENIGRPIESAEAGFTYRVLLCHYDDLRCRDFAAFLVGFAEELPLHHAGPDTHSGSRNHRAGEIVSKI